MSRAGARNRLEIAITRKAFRNASGTWVEILGPLAFTVECGEVVALVGPSGCGKTTLLRIICGLDTDYSGMVTLPADGRVGMVFQEPRLLPWRTLRDNIALAAPQLAAAELDAILDMLGLRSHAEHFPAQLSGGLARRAALARAMAVRPDLLVLDEPFISLDTALATRLREELAQMIERKPTTTLLVTHDLDEAMGLADRIIFLSPVPARIMGEVHIDRPRVARNAADLAGVRVEIDRVLKDVG